MNLTGFIQAKNYRIATRATIDLVVVHTMESQEKPHTAHAVAQWFAGPYAPMASAHVCVDNLEAWGCVHLKDIAFGAPGANANGAHIEHAGRAAQTGEQWADQFSMDTLRTSARVAAEIAHAFAIPVVHLSPEDLLAGRRGFCGHVDVTMAFHKSTHTDPGGSFPWGQYLDMVGNELELLAV